MHRCGLPLAQAEVAKSRAGRNGVLAGPFEGIARKMQEYLVGVPYSCATVEVEAVCCQRTRGLRLWIGGGVAREIDHHGSVTDDPGTAGLHEVSVIVVLEDGVAEDVGGVASAAVHQHEDRRAFQRTGTRHTRDTDGVVRDRAAVNTRATQLVDRDRGASRIPDRVVRDVEGDTSVLAGVVAADDADT